MQMMRIKKQIAIGLIAIIILGIVSFGVGVNGSTVGLAQGSTPTSSGNLVATLAVTSATVEVQRAGTSEWVAVDRETLFGVGDKVRTDAKGTAQITFFSDGTETDVMPNSEYELDTFSGSDTQYQLSATVLLGQTVQRIAKLLDGSSYTVNSTGLDLAVRGTVLAVRVEPSGRSATIVETGIVHVRSKGTSGDAASAMPSSTHAIIASATAAATSNGYSSSQQTEADVPAGFGVRAEPNKSLSDVVPATTFAELDAALDGCKAALSLSGDVQLNVRLGPGLNFPRVGSLDNNQTLIVLGQTKTSGWYRVPFKGGVGWILVSSGLKLAPTCVKFNPYPDNWPGEDAARYTGLSPDINLALTMTPTAVSSATLTSTPSATPRR